MMGFFLLTTTAPESASLGVTGFRMAVKLLKDITYPDYPEAVEVRVINKWYTRNNTKQFTYLFVDHTGYAIEAVAPSTDEADLDRMVIMQRCYRITNYTTTNKRHHTPTVPHEVTMKISRYTRFQPINNDDIPIYYFNFIPFDSLEKSLAKGSPLSDYVGRAESITDMIPVTEKTKGKTLYLRRLIIMDDRSRSIEVTLWEDKGREVDKVAALHQIVAVTATFPSKYGNTFASKYGDIRLTSTNATKFFIDPPTPNLQELKQRFVNVPHLEPATTQINVPTTDIPRITVNELYQKNQSEFNRLQFLCEAQITNIFSNRGWYYLACQHCTRGVDEIRDDKGNTMWHCLAHETMDKPTPLYALNTTIMDETGSIEAVFFNKAVEQLTGIPCRELIAKYENVAPKVLVEEIKEIQGQQKTLQLTVKLDGSVHINKIIQPPSTTPQAANPTTTLQQPTTPAPKQYKRSSEHILKDTKEGPSSAKQPKNLKID